MLQEGSTASAKVPSENKLGITEEQEGGPRVWSVLSKGQWYKRLRGREGLEVRERPW